MKKAIEFILYLVGILYLPIVVAISFLTDQSGDIWLNMVLFFALLLMFLSFHFYCVFLELGFSLLRLLEKKKRSRGEIIMNVSTISLALFMLIITLIDPERELNVLAILLSHLLIVLWILGDVIFKQRKFLPEVYKKNSFWITAVAIFAAVCVFWGITGGKFEKSEPDPLDPIAIETQIEETHTRTD